MTDNQKRIEERFKKLSQEDGVCVSCDKTKPVHLLCMECAAQLSIDQVDDFKSALRKEVENRITKLGETIESIPPHNSHTMVSTEGIRFAYRQVLELIDKVTPPKQ